MISMRRSTKILIILLVFIASIYLGLKRSNLISSFSEPSTGAENKEAINIFERSGNFKKVRIEYETIDLHKSVDRILDAINKGRGKIIFSDLSNYKYWAVFEAPDSLLEKNSNNLREIENMIGENVFTNSEADFDINIKAHLDNKKTTKSKILDLINKSSIPERVNQFTRQLEKIQAEIDSLKNQEKVRDLNRSNYLILVQVNKKVKTSNLFYSNLIKFIYTTLIVFIALVIALLLFYFIVVMLLKVMSSLGIRTSRTSSSYHYYSDKPYRRKIKRKYKPLPEDKEKKE